MGHSLSCGLRSRRLGDAVSMIVFIFVFRTIEGSIFTEERGISWTPVQLFGIKLKSWLLRREGLCFRFLVTKARGAWERGVAQKDGPCTLLAAILWSFTKRSTGNAFARSSCWDFNVARAMNDPDSRLLV